MHDRLLPSTFSSVQHQYSKLSIVHASPYVNIQRCCMHVANRADTPTSWPPSPSAGSTSRHTLHAAAAHTLCIASSANVFNRCNWIHAHTDALKLTSCGLWLHGCQSAWCACVLSCEFTACYSSMQWSWQHAHACSKHLNQNKQLNKK